MRLTSLLPLTLVAALACDDHDHPESYATYQECFDDHTLVETLPVPQAIAICCLEHPIAGVAPVCGATAPACEAYLGANLATTSATPAEVTTGCADYITQRGM